MITLQEVGGTLWGYQLSNNHVEHLLGLLTNFCTKAINNFFASLQRQKLPIMTFHVDRYIHLHFCSYCI